MKSGGDKLIRASFNDSMTRVPTIDILARSARSRDGIDILARSQNEMSRVPPAWKVKYRVEDKFFRQGPSIRPVKDVFFRQDAPDFLPVENGFTTHFKGRVPVEVGRGRGPVWTSGKSDVLPRVDPVAVGGVLTFSLVLKTLVSRAAAGAAAVFSLVPTDVIANPTGVRVQEGQDI